MQISKSTRYALALVLLITLSALSIALQGCGGDDSTSSTTNPFRGNWNIVFAGSFVGGGQIAIGTDGSFSANVLLQDASGTFTETVSGTVSNSGVLMNGRIFDSGVQIGTITGNFSGNAGSGTYQTNVPTSGTWSATRQ